MPAHQLELALWLESDRMGFFLPALTQENLDNQRDVVMNERRQRVENQPYGLAGEKLHELLYPPGHPYHWPVIGYMEDIAAATLEEAQTFFRTYYTPNNAVLTLVGDFQPEAALERIEAWFGEIPAGPPVPPAGSPAAARRRAPQGAAGRRAPAPGLHRLPRARLRPAAPGTRRTCWRPCWREASRARSTGSWSTSARSPRTSAPRSAPTRARGRSCWSPRHGREWPSKSSRRRCSRAIARAASAPPDPADLERARNRMLTDYYSALQKMDSLADLFSQFTTYFDDPAGVAGEAGRYLEITPRDLMDYAAGWCTEPERVVVSVVPRQAS